jgi:hypothetical protein
MTQASLRALEGLRDPTLLKWYAVPLLAFVFYVYANEIARARHTGDLGTLFAGVTLFGMDFFNETVNGWILALSGRSALWTAPGDTALRTMVGWNIEIMFMFAISGVVFWRSLRGPGAKLLGLPEAWVVGALYSAFCVAVELFLNSGGLLVWDYRFWNASWAGVWPIFLFGYYEFYVAVILVNGLRSTARKVTAVAAIYAVPTVMNVVGLGVLGWRY